MSLAWSLLGIATALAVHALGRTAAARLLRVGGFIGRDGPLGRRLLVPTGGAAASYLFAALLSATSYFAWGQSSPTGPPTVAEVLAGGPAARAGVSAGDEIVAIASQPVDTVEDLVRGIEHTAGDPFALELRRDGKLRTITLHAERVDGRYRVGLAPIAGQRRQPVPWWRCLTDGAIFPAAYAASTVTELGHIFVGRPIIQLAGPIGIARAIGKAPRIDRLIMIAIVACDLGLGCFLSGLILALVPRGRRSSGTAPPSVASISA